MKEGGGILPPCLGGLVAAAKGPDCTPPPSFFLGSIHYRSFSNNRVAVCFLASGGNLFPRKQTRVTMLLDSGQKTKQTF